MTPRELGNNIADNFEKIMIDKKITMSDLSEKTCTDRWAVHSFINNLREGKGGSIKTICKYADALGISPYILFYENKLVPREDKKE